VDVGIVGGSGYGGAELLRLLAAHPFAKVRVVAARTAAGGHVHEVFPHLRGAPGADLILVEPDPDALAACDVVLLATPHAASLALAPALVAAGARVVDLSGAYRLDAATFSDWYGDEHTAADLAPAVYGLPELYRDQIAAAALVANPGCYPTAALLAMAPLAGHVDPASVVISGLSGTSGAGKGLRDDLHASHAMGNAAAYGAPKHRHTPEIERIWGRLAGLDSAPPLTFTPHLVPMPRGQVVTVVATLGPDADGAAVEDSYVAAYTDEPFVHVLPPGSWPSSGHTVGGNAAHIGVAFDPRTRRVTASCALDNLVKGAAGQALQNANLLCGVEETAGLTAAGVYP
jgi:N-acetyl-gamma-glutamyl-phosphate reductase